MSMQVSYKKQFLVFLLLVLVIMAVFEIILRVYDFFNPRCRTMNSEIYGDIDYFLKKQICDAWTNHIWYMDPVSNLASSEPNQHWPTLNINNHGFRGPEILKEKPENTFRIFVVGGSTTFAIRAYSDQDTMPGYLQENFNQLNRNQNVEVINAGIPRLTSSDELQLIKTKLVKFDPNLIII